MSASQRDEALTADWATICRRIVDSQRKLFESHPRISDRDRYEGTVGEGGDRTLVLDRQCEDIVFDELERLAESRDAAFTAISEERGMVEFNGGSDTWVVIDPIDGSLNVRRTIPQHSLSLAVASAPNLAAVQFGYVYDFGADHEFMASVGQGAQLNGMEIHCQRGERLEIVGIESAEPGAIGPLIERLTGKVFRLRCLGSLALTVCFVAAGRFDGMVSPQVSRSVDIAAAQLIAREAGALIEIGDGGLAEAGLDLDQRYLVTAAGTAEGLQILLEANAG